MPRFGTFLVVLIVTGAIAYVLAHRNSPTFRNFTAPAVTIDELLKSAKDYDGKTVTVNGIVVGSIGLLGAGGFLLRDSTSRGEITVMASGGIPPLKTLMSVTGKFKQAVVIGDFQYAVIIQNY